MSVTWLRAVALGCVLVLLMAVGYTVLGPVGSYRVTAYFTQSVGLYAGSNVDVLGITVGSISEVTPVGDKVRVEMVIDDGYDIPSDAQAAVVAPSLVSDRYVQFVPVYAGGPTMADGAVLDTDRTAVPVELDQIYSALDELATALGPNGANADGALSDLVDVAADNLDGNGSALNSTLVDLSQAVQTLSESRGDLFDSLDNLQIFTTALASIDDDVAAFNQNLAAVSEQLAGEREDLSQALSLLTTALSDVSGFIQQNTALLSSNVDALSDVALTLVQERDALAEALDDAPAALSNVGRAYNASTGTLDVRDDAVDGENLEVTLCSVLTTADQLALLSTANQTICAALLSGDTDGDGIADDRNADGVSDLSALLTSIFDRSSTDTSGTSALPGIPSLLGGE